MKKIIFTIGCIFYILNVHAQVSFFDKELSWEQIKSKAKSENKFIFMDIMATWCGPCKAMETQVYNDETVSALLKERFISIKIQMDKTSADNDYVKRWYNEAKLIAQKYNVTAYPTLLFFSPDGLILNKSVGFKSKDEFIKASLYVLRPSSGTFYKDIDDYNHGIKNYNNMLILIKQIRDVLQNDSLAKAMEYDFYKNYLNKLDKENFFKKENFQFIVDHYEFWSSKTVFFDLIYKEPKRVNALMDSNNHFSNTMVKNIIEKEEIWEKLFYDPLLRKSPITKTPNWELISHTISKKYNKDYAPELLEKAEPDFYKSIGDWLSFSRIRDKQVTKFPPIKGKDIYDLNGTWALNVNAWDVFLNCNNVRVLETALKWSNLTIVAELPSPNLQFLDTKANLLYKLGRVKEAIKVETWAFELSTQGGKNAGDKEFQETIEKMKKGEKTWGNAN